MTFLVASLGALGLALFVSGVPRLRGGGIAARVEPYVGGLGGRASRLLAERAPRGRFAAWLGRRSESMVPGSSRELGRRLRASGSDANPADFRLEQLGWGLGAAAWTWAMVGAGFVSGIDMDGRAAVALGLIAFMCGVLARDWLLARAVGARSARLRAELPVGMDLVTLSLMAGEPPAAALGRVGSLVEGAVGDEFERTVADVRAGAPVVDALEALKGRVAEPSLARFCDALITGIEKGAPLADVLRVQSDDARAARRRELLEMGGRREVLMLIPVVFLIMPVIVLFALYPGLVSLEMLVP